MGILSCGAWQDGVGALAGVASVTHIGFPVLGASAENPRFYSVGPKPDLFPSPAGGVLPFVWI